LNVGTKQSVAALPPRLIERLESMSLSLAAVRHDGIVQVLSQARPLVQMLAQSPALAPAIAQRWPMFGESRGEAVAVWPGLWLAPLPERRRRAGGRHRPGESVLAVVLITEELLKSEQFQLVCDQQRVDRQAIVARIDRRTLVGRRDVGRIAAMLSYMQQDISELDRRTNDVYKLSQQLGESYEELSLLYKLSTNMAVDQPPRAFLEEACADLQEVVGLRWMALMLADDLQGMDDLKGQLVVAGDSDCSVDVLKTVGRQLLARQPEGGIPRVIDDTRTLGMQHVSDLARHLLIVSLQRDGKPMGILFGGDKLDGTHMGSVDSKLCNSLANSISIFLQNTMLYEDMQAMFLGTLHALTSSIDAKDSYTHGHSERVALMSRMLATAAGFDDHTVDRVYIAGLVHDVGKIGVPESVLCKPGRLTDEEFELIKMHPRIGSRILEDIKQMQDLIPGVLYHHERWDGRGYPDGLAGEDIPMFGRLICLADSYDAMSSDRTYRRAMAHDRVLEEIRRCAGSQFDPKLTEIFIKLDMTPLYDLMDKHEALDRRSGVRGVGS
jgi:HD-GYP domain-containing protein (c-di-GMP phosphodiesterase class II)